MEITSADIKALRDETGISVMQCKKAFEESEGDMEKARVILKKKRSEAAEKNLTVSWALAPSVFMCTTRTKLQPQFYWRARLTLYRKTKSLSLSTGHCPPSCSDESKVHQSR